MLPSKCKLISEGKFTGRDIQELTSALLESNDEVHKDAVGRERCQGNRDVDKSHRSGLDEGVVHCCFPMAQDKGTVSV